MTAARFFATRSAADWQARLRPFARSCADPALRLRARLYMEVPS